MWFIWSNCKYSYPDRSTGWWSCSVRLVFVGMFICLFFGWLVLAQCDSPRWSVDNHPPQRCVSCFVAHVHMAHAVATGNARNWLHILRSKTWLFSMLYLSFPVDMSWLVGTQPLPTPSDPKRYPKGCATGTSEGDLFTWCLNHPVPSGDREARRTAPSEVGWVTTSYGA